VIRESPSSWFPSTQITSTLFLGLESFLMYERKLQCSFFNLLKFKSSNISPSRINLLNLYFFNVSFASVGLATSDPRCMSESMIVSISALFCKSGSIVFVLFIINIIKFQYVCANIILFNRYHLLHNNKMSAGFI